VHLSPHEQERLHPRCTAHPGEGYVDESHDEAAVLTGDDAVRLPLPGGWVTTAWGSELHRVVRSCAQLTPAPAPLRGTA
jgi:hypothetical protein